jgi:outer membrane protein OmpA-like peptidoglycan-associated protein
MQKKILAIATMLIVAGCGTPQSLPPSPPPVTPQQPPVPHRGQQPALPPVHSAGPLTREGVETYMDAQESDLRSYLRGQGVLVSRRGNGLAVVVQADRLFDKGEFSDWGDAFLRALYQVLGHYDHTAIAINGYSDAGPNAEAVSLKRAKLVADGLSHYGIAAHRLTANGLGATNLRIANASDARNRRVEIVVTPNPGK